jgi:hypothetical protein
MLLRRACCARALIAVAAALGTCATVQAQSAATPAGPEARRSAAATRRTGPVRIDGRTDEAAWRTAAAASGFVQKEPVEGAPAEARTEARVLFDDVAIYVSAHLHDPEPATIARQLVRRDEFGQADWFAVGFDPRLDRRTAYVFAVTAANVQVDMVISNDDDEDTAWDAVWESAVHVDSTGWSVEMRIPLSQLRYDATAAPQTWGVDFVRRRVRTNEEAHFELISELKSGTVSQFGVLTGVEVPHAPRRVELRPYALGEALAEPVEPGNPFRTGTRSTARAGFDLRYGLGPSFTLDATVNPDFGQVEADPAVINLTAFETFFSERRPFFVQDAQIFNFRLSGGDNRLFYGRRIGRAPGRRSIAGAGFTEVPDATTILGAAKLTGRTPGGLSVGAIAAATANEHGQAVMADDGTTRRFLAEPAAWHGAVRLRQDFAGGASTIGLIGTAQRRALPGDGAFDHLPRTALSGGVDWEHQWSDRTYAFFGYVAASHVRGTPAAMTRIQRSSTHYLQRPDAIRLGVDSLATSLSGLDWRMTLEKRRGEHWTGSVWAAEVTPTFEVNDLGFSSRQEVLDGGARLAYREIRPGPVFRNYHVSASTFHNWTHDVLDAPWSAASWGRSHVNGSASLNVETTLLNYWGVEANLSFRPEMADRSATRGGPMMIQPRELELGLEFNTDERRAVELRGGLEVEWRAQGGGRREQFSFDVQVRPSPRVEFTVEPQWEHSRNGAQYVARAADAGFAPTYGSRYLFADLDQRELSLETRVNVTLSPTLTVQAFVQPLLGSGSFLTYRQLRAPRTYTFDPFTPGTVATGTDDRCVGGTTCVTAEGERLFDFDGDGASDFGTDDRNFNVRSLIGNLVLRWEYRPGSTLFLVWQRQQEDEVNDGRFDLSRDARALLGAPARNVFLLKASYWLGF